MKNAPFYKSILLVLILVLAVFLRIYKLHERTVFDADQEWLAFRALETVKGDLPLLGPTTSVGNFSIGPGFVYLWALVGLFTNHSPITGAYLSVILGIIFLLLMFFLIKHLISEKISFLMFSLLSISTTLIFWDQLSWAPSLFYIAQVLLLYGSYLAKKNPFGYPMMALSLVIGFQSHIGIFLSLFSILIYFFFVRPVKINIKFLILTLGILFLGFLPNAVYDFAHDFSNAKKLFAMLDYNNNEYFVSLNKIIKVLNANTTSYIYARSENLFDVVFSKIFFALVIVNTLILLRSKKFRDLSFLLLLTAFVPPLIFYLQQGKFSEYYLMMTVPSLILMLALFVNTIFSKKIFLVFIILISIYTNFKQFDTRYINWNLKAKETIAQKIINLAGNEGYGISLNSKPGNQFGFKYIFKFYDIRADIPPKKDEKKIFSILIPQGFDGMVGKFAVDGIGLIWQGM